MRKMHDENDEIGKEVSRRRRKEKKMRSEEWRVGGLSVRPSFIASDAGRYGSEETSFDSP